MVMLVKHFSSFLLVCAIVGCSISIPRVHKVAVQQGNILNQSMVDKLKPGMTRTQVAYVMGRPVIINTFDPDRWDYVFTIEVPGQFNETTRMSLFFENDVLTHFTGDMAPAAAKTGDATTDTE
ncbi:MAG: outer membrane protein assembly factor BamE [Pseudomonadota bacterium]|nr:outer membrane protein assembly factor BamE [Pseudomonadota bacterium]MEE3182598.1 outer membrane protein assembly factor BamE [Pseudomonadota bacterium]